MDIPGEFDIEILAQQVVDLLPVREGQVIWIWASTHIAIGANQSFGGRNRANIHLDLVIPHPTVWLDGQVILDQDLFWLEHAAEVGSV
jgi:hypothetical protein